MSIENLNENEIKNIEAEVAYRRAETHPTYQHYTSAESLSESEITLSEAEIAARKAAVNPTVQHYGSVENMSDLDIKNREAMIAAQQAQTRPMYQHYGSAEQLSAGEIQSMEAEIKNRRSEVKQEFHHHGSVENMDNEDIRILEAQVAAKRAQDIPFKDYLNGLISNPHIEDEKQFENAVNQSMQSNGIMRNFVEKLIEAISAEVRAFNYIDKNDKNKVSSQKQRVESLINLYTKYLYTLKNNEWSFGGYGTGIGVDMIDSDTLEELWQVQKEFDITFAMFIPKDMGEDYGKAYEREARLIPAVKMMYDDLKGKGMNWHQVMIYKEGELTPGQKYKQRQEQAVQVFEEARGEELKNCLIQAKTMSTPAPSYTQETIENGYGR